jgi:hypothetical protein
MYQTVEVEIPSNDNLRREIWRFCLIDNHLVLNYYQLQCRASKRHRNYELVSAYARLSYESRSFGRAQSLSEAEVPWTDFVRTEAKRKLCELFTVVRWKADLKK